MKVCPYCGKKTMGNRPKRFDYHIRGCEHKHRRPFTDTQNKLMELLKDYER